MTAVARTGVLLRCCIRGNLSAGAGPQCGCLHISSARAPQSRIIKRSCGLRHEQEFWFLVVGSGPRLCNGGGMGGPAHAARAAWVGFSRVSLMPPLLAKSVTPVWVLC